MAPTHRSGRIILRLCIRRLGAGCASWKPYSPDLGIAAEPGGASGWIRGQSAGFGLAEVGVAFVAEEDVSAPDVFVLVGGVGGVPVVAGEFLVGAG
jgi:hypothetical protein